MKVNRKDSKCYITLHNYTVYFYLDSNATVDDLQKKLAGSQLNVETLSQNLEELNQKLIGAYREYEQLRDQNAELELEKQRTAQQLQEQQQYNSSLDSDNKELQFKLNDMENRLSAISVDSNLQVCKFIMLYRFIIFLILVLEH